MTKLSRHLIEELLFYNILAKSCAERLKFIYLQIAVSNGPSFQVLNYVIKIVPQLRTVIPIGICMLVQLNVRIAQSECSDNFADFGHVDFQSQ